MWCASGGTSHGLRVLEMGEDVRIDLTVCATVSLAEAAKVLGVHRSTAWELCKRGEFPVPVLKIGTRRRVSKVLLERFVLSED